MIRAIYNVGIIKASFGLILSGEQVAREFFGDPPVSRFAIRRSGSNLRINFQISRSRDFSRELSCNLELRLQTAEAVNWIFGILPASRFATGAACRSSRPRLPSKSYLACCKQENNALVSPRICTIFVSYRCPAFIEMRMRDIARARPMLSNA